MICEYRNFGCNATIGTSFEEFEDIDLHEQRCLFRPIECFHHKCQNQKFRNEEKCEKNFSGLE